VSLNGVDLATAPLSWVRAQTAVVEQSTYLFSGTLRDNLLGGHEVAAASANDEGQSGQSHTDQGADDDAASDPRSRATRALASGHEHATQGSPQAAAGGTREGGAGDRQASFDALDEVQVGADNRDRGNIEAGIRQEVDARTRLRVGLVRGDLGARGHLRVHHDSHFFSFVPASVAWNALFMRRPAHQYASVVTSLRWKSEHCIY